jgi:mRNA interferase MazF
VACPITNTDRNYPLHVPLPDNCSLTGFMMVDQVKSVDYAARRAKLIERAPSEVLTDR